MYVIILIIKSSDTQISAIDSFPSISSENKLIGKSRGKSLFQGIEQKKDDLVALSW